MVMVTDTVFRQRAARRGIVLQVLNGILQALFRWHQRRKTERALARLNDRDLQDIGLTRTSTGYDRIRWDRDLLRERNRCI